MGIMFIISALLKLCMALGLAYVVWVLSVKESGSMKTIGMVISIAIIVLYLISALFGHSGKWMHKGMMDKSAMEKSKTMTVTGTHKPMHHLKKATVK